MKKIVTFSNFSEADTHKTQDGKTAKKGLWYNINQRKKKGLSPKKPGSDGYPKTLDIESKEVNEMLPAIAGMAVRKMATKKIGKIGGRVAGAVAAKAAMSKEKEEGYVSNAQRAAVWANRADGGKGHPDNKKKSKKEGAMKRMSTGDGMDTYKKKPDEVKKKKPIKLKDRQVKLKNFRLPNNEAFSSRAIVKKPRAGDGKPMSNKPMVRSNSPEHKAAVKKYIGGMKSNRPGTPDSKLPRQMRDPKKDAMVSKGGKVKVVDKNKEADHLKKGYVRAEDTITKELFMKEANMMVTRPGSNAPIKITTDQWPAFKARGYHHAEQKEMNMNTMKLIDRMKKASPAAKKALEAQSRVKSPNVTYDKDGKVVKKVNELTIADVRKATEKAKKRQEKERKATGKTSTSTTDLAARREGKAYGPTGVSYSDEPNLVSKPKPKKDLKAHKVAGRKSGPHKEAVQVDELSKGTMGSYIKKAKSDMGSAEQDVGSAKSKAWMLDKKTNKIGDDAAKRSRKRKAGIDTAVNKLVKTEAVDEEMIKFTEKAKKGLAAKAEKSGMPQSVLRSVYNRGMAAWKTGHRPGTTPQQWAMARVNSFTTKSSGTWGGADKDLAAKVRKEDVNPDCECEDCNCNPCECGEWRADMGPQGGGISTNDAENLGEALDMKQRLARGRSARKNKAKLSMGRKKAGRRIASMKVLKKRAQRAARKTLTKRLTKGVAKQNLSVARKREIEKKLDTKTFQVKSKRLVKRTIKDIRKKEIARKRK